MSLKSYVLHASILFAIIFSQVSLGFAAPTQNKSEYDLMEFYRLPSPDIFPELIMDLSEQGIFENTSSHVPALFFMSEVFRTHPNKAEKWCISLAQADAPVKFAVGFAIKNSDIPVATQCITEHLGLSEEDQKILEEVKPYNPIEETYTSPALLDALWGMFVASGDTRYVHRIIDALEEEIDGTKNMASMAAAWSLESMASDHPLVKEALLERSKTEEGERKMAIDEILDGLENN